MVLPLFLPRRPLPDPRLDIFEDVCIDHGVRCSLWARRLLVHKSPPGGVCRTVWCGRSIDDYWLHDFDERSRFGLSFDQCRSGYSKGIISLGQLAGSSISGAILNRSGGQWWGRDIIFWGHHDFGSVLYTLWCVHDSIST